MRAKRDAIEFLKNHGINPGNDVSYSTLPTNGSGFWLNPKTELLSRNWHIVLNDTTNNQLIVLRVPADALQMKVGNGEGLVSRADKPDLIDLHLSLESLVDRASGIDFSSFVVNKLSY